MGEGKGEEEWRKAVEVSHVTDQREKYVGLSVNIPAPCDKRSAAPTVD